MHDRYFDEETYINYEKKINQMKIKKNGKVINLTESDLKRIVKRALKENTQNEEDVVIECILGNTTLEDISKIPQSCIKMILDNDMTKSIDCMKEMDSETVKVIISKIKPISECVVSKMGSEYIPDWKDDLPPHQKS